MTTSAPEVYVGDGVYIDLPTLPYLKDITTIIRSPILSQAYYEKYYLPEEKKKTISTAVEYQKNKSKNRSNGSLYGYFYMWYARDSGGITKKKTKFVFNDMIIWKKSLESFERKYIIDRPYNRFSINNLKRTTKTKATSRGCGHWGRDYLTKQEVMEWCDMNNINYKKSWKYHKIADELLKVIDTK
tara:strand:+ start:31 stop:588 length:558 start_codon:yes stop_codon:yes gene_type:complete